ncbi:MAG: hypothetical protein RBT86_04415 [Azospira sp.]|nr:hypothetical protein [Azospira sp.]
MKTRHICLPPGQVSPGMTLALPILSPQGAILLAAGATLDEAKLGTLVRRGVEFVTVALPDERDEETIAQEQQAAAERIDFIFRGPSTPSRDALRITMRLYRKRELA